MMMIDILFPPLDRVYDFEVKEEMTPEDLMTKVLRIIYEEEKEETPVEMREFFFVKSGDFLKNGVPLGKQKVMNGDRLILL